MSTSTSYLATVRDITGRIIHLGPFEEAYGIAITPDRITLGIDRAKVKHTYAGDLITARGKQLYVFDRQPTGSWSATVGKPLWWSTDELCVTRSRPERDRAWEAMCHRPGTSKTPLDNSDRQSQGYA